MRRTATKSKPAPPKPSATVAARPLYPAWLAALLLVLATFLAYQPVWHAGFIWDDDSYVTENLTLRSASGLARIWMEPSATPQYYPLVHTSFWLEYHLWGLKPLGYHVDNVLLHILAVLLLWRVLLRLELPGAWLVAGIFALHPVNVESVAWVTERKNVLAVVLYFAAALAWWKWREPCEADQKRFQGSTGCYFAAFALFIAALLSKTVTCSFPAAMLLVIWWKRGRLAGRDVWPLLPFFGAGMALGLVTSWLERTHVGASGPEWALSFSDRCLIAGRALWFYAGKLFWPANLSFVYPRWQIDKADWRQWIYPIAALAVVGLFWCLRHRMGRGPLVAALFFGGTLLPALGFANIYPMRFSFVADHYQYLACIGLIALAVALLGKILQPIPIAAALLPLGLAVLTWRQAHIYSDQETLWEDTLTKNPDCWLAHNNLSAYFIEKGQFDKAGFQAREALRLQPDNADAFNNLGLASFDSGQIDMAITQYQTAIRLKPNHVRAHYNLGIALDKEGRVEDAFSQYQEAVRLQPDDADLQDSLGNALLKKGQIDESTSHFEAAIALRPEDGDFHDDLGSAFLKKDRFDEALTQLQEAIRLQPDRAHTHNMLGIALGAKGQIDLAISQFQEALRLQPDYDSARDNLAHALEMRNGPAR